MAFPRSSRPVELTCGGTDNLRRGESPDQGHRPRPVSPAHGLSPGRPQEILRPVHRLSPSYPQGDGRPLPPFFHDVARFDRSAWRPDEVWTIFFAAVSRAGACEVLRRPLMRFREFGSCPAGRPSLRTRYEVWETRKRVRAGATAARRGIRGGACLIHPFHLVQEFAVVVEFLSTSGL